MKKRKGKNSKIATVLLLFITFILVVFGIFSIKYNFQKANKAKTISEQIWKLYINSKK